MNNRNVWIIAVVLIIMLLGINNTVYYFYTKKSLERDLSREMATVAKQIELSVEQARLGAEKFQDQLGEQLRTASIAAQFALDPDIEKVTSEQLVELAKRLNVLHITLLKRTKDDILLYRSSDPTQLGKSGTGLPTRTWKPWYQAFNQLFDERRVTIDWGQSLPNFWTGPFEFATSDTSKVYKWGYYFDGTTNYIVDPYISYDVQKSYEEATGVDRLIRNMLKENKTLLEITGVNPPVFQTGPVQTITYAGELLNHTTQQPVIFGSYTYRVERDAAVIKKVYETGKIETIRAQAGDKQILKSYIPVDIERTASIQDENGRPINRYVLTVVSDYQTIQTELDKQFVDIGLLIAAVTLLSVIIGMFTLRNVRRSREQVAYEAQQAYIEEMNRMFDMIRSQRHDFSNHVQTLHSLAQLNKLDDLRSYAKDLAGEIRIADDFINIGNPAIAALVRSRLSQAETGKIDFESRFSGLERLDLGVKSLDMIRMIGNLVDNAFDEVMNYGEEKRKVSLEGSLGREGLVFTVSNYCRDAESVSRKDLFKAGYTTKGTGNRHGLGLSIVKSIADKYKGTVQAVPRNDDRIAFIVRIPH